MCYKKQLIMVPVFIKSLFLVAVVFLMTGCKKHHSPIPPTDDQVFGAYWNQGKAEISSYELSQSRYGAIHDGKTILIFVTEDFSKSKHVKLDEPKKHKSDAIRVMKLNSSKEFVTGIYNYAMMTSVHMPVDHAHYPHSLKLTASTQEWCGQSFMQARWKSNRYEVQQMSYFESEGDAEFSLAQCSLEDELWTLIRIAPNALATGELKLIPSVLYLRLSHHETKAYDAVASLKENGGHYTYSVYYPDLKRKLDIDFEKVFPYRILGWKEVYGENEITTGRILNTIMSDYWLHNQPVDEALRDQLHLTH
jgi:hypothetical protein